MPQHYTQVEISRFNQILNRLSDDSMIDLTRFDLIVYGGGGQHKRFYAELKTDPDLEIIWNRSSVPKWLRFFSFFPAEAGLIRVLNPMRLRPLFEELGALSKSEIFYIPRELTHRMAEKMFRKERNVLDILEDHDEYLYLRAQLDDFVQHEPDCYFLYDYRLGPATAAVIKTVFNGL
jgi:hypothetical protein